MSGTGQSRAGEAFRRLLADASVSEQSRLDVLVAFSQRTVWVATWEPQSAALRTLEHESGHIGLPVFSDEWELDKAAAELGWNQPMLVRRKEIGGREAIRQLLDNGWQFVVVDVASQHCLEASRAELEPLVARGARSESHGPFAAVGRITSTMLDAVRATQGTPDGRASGTGRASSIPSQAAPLLAPRRTTSAPPPASELTSLPLAPAVPRMSASELPPAPPIGRQSVVGALANLPPGAVDDGTATLAPVNFEPSESLLDAVSAVLKAYLEVEWASYCLVSISGGPIEPMIGIRIDASMSQRLPEIVAAIAAVPEVKRVGARTLVLDRLTKEARVEGVPFHPWRRKKTGQFSPVS